MNLLNILLCRLKQRKLILAKHTREADIDLRECETKLPHVSPISAISVHEGMIGRNEKKVEEERQRERKGKEGVLLPQTSSTPTPKRLKVFLHPLPILRRTVKPAFGDEFPRAGEDGRVVVG